MIRLTDVRGGGRRPASSLGAAAGSALARPTHRLLIGAFVMAGEFRRVLASARREWAAGRRPWFAAALACLTIVVYLLLHDSAFAPTLWRSGEVSASLPLRTELWRLPMSLFLPTPFLPVWGAAAQLLVVIGLGELVLGRWLTVTVASFGHLAATLCARAMIELCPGNLACLPAIAAHVLDTGPSAAVTAVGVCLLLVARCYRATSVLVAALLVSAVVAHGLDGQEHLLALAFGVMAGVAGSRRATAGTSNRNPSRSVQRSAVPRAKVGGAPPVGDDFYPARSSMSLSEPASNRARL